MVGIEMLSGTIGEDMLGRLAGQNKKQREGLSLLVATMLDVRSANLMDLAASLPRACRVRQNGWTCAISGSAGFWATT